MVSFDWRKAWFWVARRRPLRRVGGLLLRSFSRRVLARFDQEVAPRAQTRLLLGLLHRARQTPFGREHDFARMRTPEDYRRLVPLSAPSAPMTAHHDAAHRASWRVALALALHAGTRLPLVPGGFVVLDGTAEYADRLPCWIAPCSSADPGPRAVCLAGPVDRLLRCTEPEVDSRKLGDAMPDLSLVLYQREPGVSVEPLRAAVKEGTVLLEMVRLLDAPVAVEDPRSGGLRLLADCGAYFEFVPLDQVHAPSPPRLPLDQVALGTPYELVLTTAAGLWSCRTGQVLSFDRLAPPLVTRLGPVPAPPVVSVASVPAPAVPPPRPRSDGIPGVPTGTFGHTLWSTRAGRG